MMRYVCEVAGAEHIVEAETPEDAAKMAAAREAGGCHRHRFTVNVAEANEANLPLIAGDDYYVEIGPEDGDTAPRRQYI